MTQKFVAAVAELGQRANRHLDLVFGSRFAPEKFDLVAYRYGTYQKIEDVLGDSMGQLESVDLKYNFQIDFLRRVFYSVIKFSRNRHA